MFCPSIHPSSRSPGEMSIVGVGPEESERKPIRAILGRCCASTASGTTMRPPVKVPRNIRRSNPIPLAGPCRIEGTGRDGQWGESIPAGVKRATASCRPKVYYRVELAESILRGAERDPHLHLSPSRAAKEASDVYPPGDTGRARLAPHWIPRRGGIQQRPSGRAGSIR